MPYLTEVSIILPCFNGEKFIFSTIESIKNQVFKNWECIIIDDKSSDNSFKIIKESINNDKRFYLISNKTNLGVGKSRNIGIKKSKGRYITFIDSDDLWLPKKLLNHLDFIKKTISNPSNHIACILCCWGNNIGYREYLKRYAERLFLLRICMRCITSSIRGCNSDMITNFLFQ